MAALHTSDTAGRRAWPAAGPAAVDEASTHRADSRHSFTDGGGEELPIAT